MRTPWISRELHDETVRALREEHAVAMTRSHQAYTDLFAAYRELRNAGANPKEPERVVEPRTVDRIQSAINARTGGRPELRAAALRQVAIDKKAGLNEDEIIARIHRGSRPADEVHDVPLTSNPSGGNSPA